MYEHKMKPYAHQSEALSRSLQRDVFAFLMEMGTGKTKVAIDEMCILNVEGKIQGALVLAPKGVYENWTSIEIPEHMPDSIVARTAIYLWDGAGTKRSQNLLNRCIEWDGFSVMVMNTEAFSMSEKAKKVAERFLRSRTCAMYIDESTLIKSHTASRTKAITKIGALAKYRRIMTGSPVTRSPLDFYAQFNFLKPGLLGTKNWHAFRARYALMDTKYFGGRSIQTVVGYRNVEDLAERVRDHSFRVTKDECLDLPPKVFVKRRVHLTDEQRRIYEEMREEAFSVVGDGFVNATVAITQILRLHQIVCGHVTDADGNTQIIPSNRMSVLSEVLDEVDGKCIIWAKYRQNVAEIAETLRRERGETSVVEYHGGVDQRDRREAVDRFQNDPTCRYFVANQQTGGYGITLTAASCVVYFANDYDLEKRLQSEDRAHRSGQTKSVTYVDLVAPNTVDDKIIEALRNKKNLADLVTGDKFKEWLAV